jgi:DNA-binding NtrC family response regulator
VIGYIGAPKVSEMLRSPDEEVTLLGESLPMAAVRQGIIEAARTHAKVLIIGETGVGKEVVANLIHRQSPRRGQPFVALNCSGIPETLLESELFGHVRGSFTGAYRDKPGLVRQAEGGTLFLDELGEMSLRMQAVLLRFTETGEVQPVGADRPAGRANVRLITATNRDLRAQIAEGKFREDLYYRLNVIQLRIPPVRERSGDVPLLLRFFLERASQLHGLPCPELSPEAEAIILRYPWPGNVRELKNITERLVVRDMRRPVTPDDLPAELRGPGREQRQPGAALDLTGLGLTTADSIAGRPSSVADILWQRMLDGDNFWTVAEMYKNHDITRADLRMLIHRGLQQTRGNYRALLGVFNLPANDYKRFQAFLFQHKCNLPFRSYRGSESVAASNKPKQAYDVAS